MTSDLEQAIHDISLRMRLLRSSQLSNSTVPQFTEREETILFILSELGEMAVSQIANIVPRTSVSTISTTITNLWKRKFVIKQISPTSQRVTLVSLTKKGLEVIDTLKQSESERYRTLIRALSVTEDEREMLIDIVNRAVGFFDKHLNTTVNTK